MATADYDKEAGWVIRSRMGPSPRPSYNLCILPLSTCPCQYLGQIGGIYPHGFPHPGRERDEMLRPDLSLVARSQPPMTPIISMRGKDP